MEPASFIRHYEDAARIIVRLHNLPPLGMEIEALIDDMASAKQIRHPPRANDPAWLLRESSSASKALRRAHEKTAIMFWGKRFSLEESCEIIRDWLQTHDALR